MRTSTVIRTTVALVGAISVAAGNQVSFDGYLWQSIGQAQLSVTSSGLQVSNIGASGNDGVSLLLPNSFPNGVSLIDLTTYFPPWPYPDGPPGPPYPFFQQTGVGTINGVPNQIADTMRMTATASGVIYTPDFSPLAPSSLGVDYYLQGTTVLSETGLNPITSATESPTQFLGVGTFGWCLDESGEKLVPDFYKDDTVQSFSTFGGGQVTADTFDIYPEGIANTFGGYSALDLTASQVPTFTITSVGGVPEPATLSLVGLGGLALLWRRHAAKS